MNELRALLLRRLGRVYLDSHGPRLADDLLDAVETELASLGHVLSYRLRERLASASLDEVIAWRSAALELLARKVGGGVAWTPLFASFPDGIPADTHALWVTKVLVHFAQDEEQPCLFCAQTATTHVLEPCRHVVCDRCFDGQSYTACPVCEHHVDRRSPFFRAPPPRERSKKERVRFKRLDLGVDALADVRQVFVSLCERKQALSPDDKQALVGIVRALGTQVHAWLPAKIPVRENVAHVFGSLLQLNAADEVLPVARGYLKSATDVLRVIAVMSGADASLAAQRRLRWVDRKDRDKFPHHRAFHQHDAWVYLEQNVRRFKVAKLTRPVRRAIFAVLEGLAAESLIEDMLRHRSFWIWLGEFLHPGEYAKRFPQVARAFEIVRQHGPDGAPAPSFQPWASRYEAAALAGDASRLISVLGERPGELARRLDRSLRTTAGSPAILELFAAQVGRMATPVLMTLRSGLARRDEKARQRVYWPKGDVARGVFDADRRALLGRDTIDRAVSLIEADLLRRFADKPPLADVLIDAALADVIVPFNERTASRSAVALPRGSRVPVPMGKTARLFMHWCQPEKGGHATDLDLSVGFYDAAWQPAGVCSFYQLQAEKNGRLIATSGGDLRDAPFPHGASELVDVDIAAAGAAGIRYAVMIVNNYSGMPFSALERGFAGLMWRDDVHAEHFDPRTVALRFALAGENGIFLPFVLDLQAGVLHWLDVQAKGDLALNTVASSSNDVARICPALIDYFGSGARPSMFDLGLLHAAARASRVHVRRAGVVSQFVRRDGEAASAFLARLRAGEADEPRARLPSTVSLALLFEGDVALDDTPAYVLFPGALHGNLAAADLIA